MLYLLKLLEEIKHLVSSLLENAFIYIENFIEHKAFVLFCPFTLNFSHPTFIDCISVEKSCFQYNKHKEESNFRSTKVTKQFWRLVCHYISPRKSTWGNMIRLDNSIFNHYLSTCPLQDMNLNSVGLSIRRFAWIVSRVSWDSSNQTKQILCKLICRYCFNIPIHQQIRHPSPLLCNYCYSPSCWSKITL